MKILSIEIMSNAAGILLIEGNKNAYSVTNLKKPIAVPKDDISIKNLLQFESDFSSFLKSQNVESVVLCEGGNDSKKMRVRMEYAILRECEIQNIKFQTYPTGSCTRIINSTYSKETNKVFSDDLKTFNLPKYMGKTLAAGWRFLS